MALISALALESWIKDHTALSSQYLLPWNHVALQAQQGFHPTLTELHSVLYFGAVGHSFTWLFVLMRW